MEAGTKFIGINPNVNTVEKKSAQANSPTEVYTIEEIRGGYKSFVGYFTVNPIFVTYESLTLDHEYMIVQNDGGADFTAVGAVDSNVGTVFVATGENPDWGDPSATLVDMSSSKFSIDTLFNSIGFTPSITVDYITAPTKAVVGINFPSEPIYENIVVIMPNKDGKIMYYYTGDIFDILITDSYPTIGVTYAQPIDIRVYE